MSARLVPTEAYQLATTGQTAGHVQLQQNVHRSQNRIEAYHQLRSALAQVGGRKELIGHTDLDVAISNECGRLVANIVIAYNSILLSEILNRYQAA